MILWFLGSRPETYTSTTTTTLAVSGVLLKAPVISYFLCRATQTAETMVNNEGGALPPASLCSLLSLPSTEEAQWQQIVKELNLLGPMWSWKWVTSALSDGVTRHLVNSR